MIIFYSFLFFFGFYSACKFGFKVVKLVWHNVVVSVYLSASFDFKKQEKKEVMLGDFCGVRVGQGVNLLEWEKN